MRGALLFKNRTSDFLEKKNVVRKYGELAKIGVLNRRLKVSQKMVDSKSY